jgi:hypothetical protein
MQEKLSTAATRFCYPLSLTFSTLGSFTGGSASNLSGAASRNFKPASVAPDVRRELEMSLTHRKKTMTALAGRS